LTEQGFGTLQALYIAGHSLGAASASMLALLLVVEPAYQEIVSRLKAVYTFRAPMIASPELAADCDEHALLRERVIRYVYANDIVPQLPPSESGPFKHFGTGYQDQRGRDTGSWQHNDAPRKQLRNPLEVLVAPLTLFAPDFKLTRRIQFHASIRDHMPQYDIDALTPRECTASSATEQPAIWRAALVRGAVSTENASERRPCPRGLI
jgi:hypothetical protein